jgi:tetratricopeptide (TPR) repeat protein
MRHCDDADSMPALQLTARRKVYTAWWFGAPLLAAAAAIAIILVPSDLWRGDGGDSETFELLSAAVGETRIGEGRLTGFDYRPARPLTRSRQPGRPELRALVAVDELGTAALRDPSPTNRHAHAIALLLAGRYDDAIEGFGELVASDDGNAAYLTDLAAAYLARGPGSGGRDDWDSAERAAKQALQIAPASAEARFNLAVALQGAERTKEALTAWKEYLAIDSSSPWADEARARIGSLAR